MTWWVYNKSTTSGLNRLPSDTKCRLSIEMKYNSYNI